MHGPYLRCEITEENKKMRVDQAKAIAMERLLGILGHAPHHTKGHELWYLSPFREEAQASFKVNTTYNSWYDFGAGRGGNILDFVMVYFQVPTVSDALRELDRIGGIRGSDAPLPLFPKAPVTMPEPVPSPPPSVARSTDTAPPSSETARASASGITLKKVQPLQNRALLQYLRQRGIPGDIARPYVQEAYYTVAGRDRTYFALAFANESGGMELRNPYFKGCHGRKDISLILPDAEMPPALHLFEGFTDFLSWLVYGQVSPPRVAALVLNSTSLRERAVDRIRSLPVTSVTLYCDRDASGHSLTAQFQEALEGVSVTDESAIYTGYKDFNAFLCERAGSRREQHSI